MAVSFLTQNYSYKMMECFLPSDLEGRKVPELVKIYNDLVTFKRIKKITYPSIVQKWLTGKLQAIEKMIMLQMRHSSSSPAHPKIRASINTIVDSPQLSFNAKRQALIATPIWPNCMPIYNVAPHDENRLVDFVTLGADVNAKLPGDEQTPIFFINSIDVLNVFIAKGANLNAKDWKNCTVLHRRDGIQLLTRFLHAGADVNACAISNLTPLHLLPELMNEQAETADLFIRYGAKVNQLNDHGQMPLDVIHHSGTRAILLAKGARCATPAEKRYSKDNIRRAKKVSACLTITTAVVAFFVKQFS